MIGTEMIFPAQKKEVHIQVKLCPRMNTVVIMAWGKGKEQEIGNEQTIGFLVCTN